MKIKYLLSSLFFVLVFGLELAAQNLRLQKNHGFKIEEIKKFKRVRFSYFENDTIKYAKARFISLDNYEITFAVRGDTLEIDGQKLLKIRYINNWGWFLSPVILTSAFLGTGFVYISIAEHKDAGFFVPFILGGGLMCGTYFMTKEIFVGYDLKKKWSIVPN